MGWYIHNIGKAYKKEDDEFTANAQASALYATYVQAKFLLTELNGFSAMVKDGKYSGNLGLIYDDMNNTIYKYKEIGEKHLVHDVCKGIPEKFKFSYITECQARRVTTYQRCCARVIPCID